MHTQDDINHKLEDRLSVLYDTALILGDQVQALHVRTSLKCHAEYTHVCVTSVTYNASMYGWDRVKRHLLGVWSHTNLSFDLLELHRYVLDMQNTPHLSYDVAQTVQDIAAQMAKQTPHWSDFFR